jgi:rhodanese-related sulfurtransferase
MGNISSSIKKISFEDIQFVIKNSDNSYVLINTMNSLEQECLILNTLPYEKEEALINEYMKQGKKNKKIIIYGKNNNDEKIITKYYQLINLGFYNVYVYSGGLFEWLLLQDIYGFNEFPTTKKELDLLKFKPLKSLNIPLLEY